ncbi:hypothetical protein [Burkholderia gladioli]|uniref:hypothetical protein n=1 Tax=Burkholderia gladioli TaxID=28095 RepID=UPI001640836C|nr:hypothetical protein [Burkholderia gladioli]
MSPHVHDAAVGVEPAWLGEAAHADRTDALKLSLSDLLQDGAPDLFPANGSLEKPATCAVSGAADLPGLASDLSDMRASNDAAGAGMPHLSHDNGMSQLDWSVSHGIDIHST